MNAHKTATLDFVEVHLICTDDLSNGTGEQLHLDVSGEDLQYED